MSFQRKKVSIVGSGVGGLATAIRLAAMGHEVTVFEKNNYSGGKLSHFTIGSYSFDAGPSLFTQPENIEELFRLSNKDIRDYFRYYPVSTACKYFFENGAVINAYTEKEKFAAEMESKLGEPSYNIINYLNNASHSYHSVGSLFLTRSLHKVNTWISTDTLKALAATRPAYLIKNLNSYNQSKFKTREAVQIFNRFATYNGSNPYKAPGMLSMIPHLEHNQGTYYPEGGMISITQALYKLALHLGVKFEFNTEVNQILTEKNEVSGIHAGGATHKSDIVVSNMDVFYTYKNLLANPAGALEIERNERSSSALIFYWGINKKYSELDLHNIFFSNNYEEEFDTIFNHKRIYHDPTIYINITAKMESGHAPDYGENWFVMVNAPHDTGQDWSKLRSFCRQAVIDKLNRMLKTDLESQIEVEEFLDPIIIRNRTASYTGSLYGTSSNSRMSAFFRHPNFSRSIKGLYFVGGSVHPGGGIPLCMHSAKIVSELINE